MENHICTSKLNVIWQLFMGLIMGLSTRHKKSTADGVRSKGTEMIGRGSEVESEINYDESENI